MNKSYYYNMFSPAMNIFSRGGLSFSRLNKLYFFHTLFRVSVISFLLPTSDFFQEIADQW